MPNKQTIEDWRKVIEGKNEENQWNIKERLSHELLQANLDALNDEYAGRLVLHKSNQDCYRISHFSVLNANSTAEYAVNYHPFDKSQKRDYLKIKHTRPAREFFDGRFLL